jgi:hypothetical protein
MPVAKDTYRNILLTRKTLIVLSQPTDIMYLKEKKIFISFKYALGRGNTHIRNFEAR